MRCLSSLRNTGVHNYGRIFSLPLSIPLFSNSQSKNSEILCLQSPSFLVPRPRRLREAKRAMGTRMGITQIESLFAGYASDDGSSVFFIPVRFHALNYNINNKALKVLEIGFWSLKVLDF